MVEIRTSRLFRIFSIIGILILWSMAFIGWIAYRQEEARFGLALMAPTLAIGLYWLIALATAPSALRFDADALSIRRWLGRKQIPYDEITAVSQSYPFITITTHSGPVRLHKLYANDDARLFTALETHVPSLQKARTARLQGGFPLIVTPKWTAAIGSGLIGLMLAGFGAAILWFAFTQPEEVTAFQRWFMPLMGLLSIFFGGLFLYLLLWTFPRRTTFTPAQMRQHFLLRTAVQPMDGIIAFESGHEVRHVRGVPRQVHHIVFHYTDGRSFQWTPGEFAFPLDYIDVHEANRVADLTTQLRQAYLSPASPSHPDGPAREERPPPPQTAAARTLAIINRAKALPIDDYMYEFETLRDDLNRLGPDALPTVLEQARRHSDHSIIDLLVTVLADHGYRPALPDFVAWLDHPNDEVRFAAAMALDMAADGRFGIEKMIVGGWVQHDQIRAAVPAIREWWRRQEQ